jgi:hypothetical protein
VHNPKISGGKKSLGRAPSSDDYPNASGGVQRSSTSSDDDPNISGGEQRNSWVRTASDHYPNSSGGVDRVAIFQTEERFHGQTDVAKSIPMET